MLVMHDESNDYALSKLQRHAVMVRKQNEDKNLNNFQIVYNKSYLINYSS